MSDLARITPAQFAALDGLVNTGKLLADFGMTYRMNSAGLIRWNTEELAWEITDYGSLAHSEHEKANPKTEVDHQLLDFLIALVQLEGKTEAEDDDVTADELCSSDTVILQKLIASEQEEVIDLELIELTPAELAQAETDPDVHAALQELGELVLPGFTLDRPALPPAAEPVKKPRHRGRRATRAKAIA